MKKLILLAILGIGIFCAFSCTRSCTCVNPDTGALLEEREVNPSEKCSSLNTENVECS